jgi:hypothetical protein
MRWNSPTNSRKTSNSKLKVLKFELLILFALMMCWVDAVTCSADMLPEYVVERSYTYSLQTPPFGTIAGVLGPVTGVPYTLDSIDNGAKYGILKRNIDYTQNWSIYVSGITFGERWMVIKSDESSFFVIGRSTTIYLFEFSWSDGSIIRALDHSANYDTNFDFPGIVLSSNDADIYFTVNKILGNEKTICKFALSGTSIDCYYISSIVQIDPVLQITSSDIFISGFTNTSPNNLFVMRLIFGSTTPVWKKEANWLFTDWAYDFGSSILNTDGTTLFLATIFGPTIASTYRRFYILKINSSDGSLVDTIRRTDVTWNQSSMKLVIKGDYLNGLICSDSSTGTLFNFRITNPWLVIKTFNNVSIKDIGIFSEKVKMFGINTLGKSVLLNVDILLSPSCNGDTGELGGSYQEIGHTYADSSLTVTSDGSSTFNGYSGYVNGLLTFVEQSIWYPVNIISNTDTETIQISAKKAFSIVPNLSCSIIYQFINYTFSEYGGIPVPEWISIESPSGVVSGTSPWDAEYSQYKVYIDSSPGVGQKLLIISIEDDSAWNSGVTDWSKFATHSAQVLTILGISMSLGIFALSGAYPSGIWAIVEQIQLIILVISKEVFIPIDIDYYLKGNIELLFNYASIPVLEVPFFAEVSEWLDLEQNVSAASELELESRSTFKNHFTMIMIILLVSLCYLITKLTPNWFGNRLSSFFGKFKAKILFFIGFVFYVRILLEGFLSLTLSSVAEIYQFKGESYQEIASFALSIAFLLIWVALLLVSIFYSCKFRNQTLPSKFRFMELFTGLRKSKWAHFYTPLSLSRRLLFVLIIVLSNNDNRESIFAPLILIQIIFWMYVIVIRSFETTGDNILQIQIEAFITIAIVYFYPFSSEEKWSQTATDAFLGIIFANSWLIFIILFSKRFDSNRNSPRNCCNQQSLKK